MKTDVELKSDVTAELTAIPRADPAGVAVAVKDGIVTLSGTVDSYLQKQAIERLALRVPGVRGLAPDLEVRLAADHRRTDSDIAQAARHALRWHSLVPDDRVEVEVDDGRVTLRGELDWGYQSASAEQAVRPLVGVRGVSNAIRLVQRVDPKQMRADIAAALTRHAQREADHLAIEVDAGVVTLSGKVGSLPEHDAVLGTACAARGVTRVIDHLDVAA